MPDRRRRIVLAAACLAALLVLWTLTGIRQIDPEREYGVLDGVAPGPFPMLVEGRWVLSPPGLLRLHRYSRLVQEVPLPGAGEAMLRASGGRRYGFNGWVSLRPDIDRWEEVHAASLEGGIRSLVAGAARTAGEGLEDGLHAGLGWRRFREEFALRLSDELLRRGATMGRVGLESLEYLTADPADELDDPGTRLLVIGLDGADWAILDPLLEQGRLPNLDRLVRDGARAKLLSLSPMLSPVIWTTAATGVEPTRHGILDFLVPDEDGEGKQPVTSRQRRVPAVWEILGDAGISAGVVAWWASWPADPIHGYMVSERVAYQLFNYRADPEDPEGKTWPPGLYREVRPRIVLPETIGWERVAPFLSGKRKTEEEFTDPEERKLLEDFCTLLASGDTYVNLATDLSRRYEPRFEAVYLESTDTIGHLFMRYRPPRLPGVRPSRYDSFREMVDRYYELADEYLGRLLEGRGEDWTVMILSDHGFASDSTRPRTAESAIGHGQAATWHRRFGVLILHGANVRRGVRLDRASIYDIAPTILALFGRPVPASWPGRVLAGALDETFLDRYPVRLSLEDPVRAGPDAGEPTSEEMDRDMLEKLAALGYIAEESTEKPSVTFSNNSGVARMAEGDLAGAEQSFREGLREHPDHPMLLANLGLALRLQGKREEAAGILERAMSHPKAQRMAGHHLGQIFLATGELDRAERYLRSVLEAEPDAVEILNTLGLVLEGRGETGEAKELYLHAARQDPDAALPRNNLGNIARRRGESEAAERWYREAIESDPYFIGAYNNLALVYQDRGDLDRATDLYAGALEKDPNNAVVLNNLASLYYNRGNLEEARKLWARSVRVHAGYPSPYNNLAGIAIVQQRYDDAEALLNQALEIEPEYGDARINLALVRRMRGDLAGAREQLQRALADPRARRQGLLQLGFLEMRSGNYAEAAGLLQEVRPEVPHSTDLLNALGEAYARLGEPDLATLAWEDSLRIDPNQEKVRELLER